MNSANILMNLAPTATAGAPAAEAESGSCEGFSAALSALQIDPTAPQAAVAPQAEVPVETTSDAEDVSALAIIASLLMQAPNAAANEAGGKVEAPDAGEQGTPGATGVDLSPLLSAASTTGNSLAATQAPTDALNAAAASAAPQDPAVAASVMRAATTRGTGAKRDSQDVLDSSNQSVAGKTGDSDADAGDRLLLDKLQNAFTAIQPAAANAAAVAGAAVSAAASAATGAASQSVAAAVHLATTLTREGSADVTSPLHATIREPVGSPRWAEEISSRLMMMSVRGQQEGSLTLTPEHLGPLEVQISVNKDTANVWFGAQHADTRAALTDAMPRLRELLAASGLSLGQSGVSEQTPRRSAADAVPGGSGSTAATDLNGVAELAAPAWRPLRSGLIDTYA